MQITYSLEPEDLWRYNKFLINRVATYKFRLLLRLAIVPIGILLLFLSQQFNWWQSTLALFAAACLWVPFCFWSLRRHYLKTIQEQPGVVGMHTLEISSEGVSQQTSTSKSLLNWNGFSEIVENNDQVLFFISQKFAVVIPKHAFQSQDQVKHFLDMATAYWKGNPVPALLGQETEVWPPPPHRGTF